MAFPPQFGVKGMTGLTHLIYWNINRTNTSDITYFFVMSLEGTFTSYKQMPIDVGNWLLMWCDWLLNIYGMAMADLNILLSCSKEIPVTEGTTKLELIFNGTLHCFRSRVIHVLSNSDCPTLLYAWIRGGAGSGYFWLGWTHCSVEAMTIIFSLRSCFGLSVKVLPPFSWRWRVVSHQGHTKALRFDMWQDNHYESLCHVHWPN